MISTRTSTLQNSNALWQQINSTNNKFHSLSEQIASGIKVSKMTDDVVSAKGIIKANKELDNIDTYIKNMQIAQTELGDADKILSKAIDQVQRALDISTTAANGTYNDEQLASFATELGSIIDSLTSIANTNYNGVYIFAGTETTQPPFVSADDPATGTVGMNYEGNDGKRYVITGDGEQTQINFIGTDIFGSYKAETDPVTGTVTETGDGLFSTLYKLKKALTDTPPDTDTIRQSINNCSAGIDKITETQVKLGNTDAQFDNKVETYENNKLQITKLKSSLEDTDLAEATTKWYSSYQSLQASFSILSQSMGTSLLNYI